MINSASIIITSYNYEKFVGATINSALSQTFSNIEVIVVDDGSTDGSLDVIRSFGDRIITIVQQNAGLAGAEYAGFVRATGDVILFLDSDDVLYPTAIEEATALFASDTTKVQFYLRRIDAKGQSLGSIVPRKMPREEEIENQLFRFGCYPYPPTSGNVYRRQFLEQVLPITDPDLQFRADRYLAVLAPVYGKVRVAQKILGDYRTHGQNFSVTSSPLRSVRARNAAIVATQRVLEIHCAKFNKPPVRPALYLRHPYDCKLRLLSLKAHPAAHPYPEDRAYWLALHGILATFRSSEFSFSLAKRVSLLASFLLLLLLPSSLARRAMPLIFESRGRLVASLQRAIRSARENMHSSKQRIYANISRRTKSAADE